MRTAAALFVSVVCLLGRSTDARVLCVGEPCIRSQECDRNSLCYARYRTATEGICLVRQGLPVAEVPSDGSRCNHAGDCGPCSVCSEGVCVPSATLKPGSTHADSSMQQLAAELTEEERKNRDLTLQLRVERSQNDRLEKTVRMEEDSVHSLRHASVFKSLTGKFIVAAGSVVLAVFAVALAYLKRQNLLARDAAARATARAAAAASSEPQAHELETESEDEDVPEDEERALLSSHEAAAPAELDPEDPNTCKVCFDHVIDCVLVCLLPCSPFSSQHLLRVALSRSYTPT